MGFPGRLNEKKRVSVMFWMSVAVAVGLLGWISWLVAGALRKPLTPGQRQQIYNNSQPGYIQKKADKAGDDIKQIINREPLKNPPPRVYRQGGAVITNGVYDASDKNKDAPAYYSDGAESIERR